MSDAVTPSSPPEAPASSENISIFLKEKGKLIQSYRTINNVLTLFLVGVLLFFIALFYTAMTNNFSVDRLQKAVAEQGPTLVSPLTDAAIDVVLQTYPVYQDQLSTAFATAVGTYAQTAQKEIATFSEQVGKDAQEQFDKLFEKVLTSKDGVLAREVPSLQVTKEMLTRIQEKNVDKSTQFLSKKMMADVETLRKTVFKFDTPSLPKSDAELSRRMIHDLIMLVDQEYVQEVK